MSTRHNILAEVWTDENVEFGGLEVQRPSSHRLNVLMRRRNLWVAEEPRDQTELEALAEWFFVLTRSREELSKLFRVELAEWELIIDDFLAEIDEEALNEFRGYLEAVMKSMEAGAVTDAAPGKHQRKGERNHAS